MTSRSDPPNPGDAAPSVGATSAPRPYHQTIQEPPIVSVGHGRAFIRQSLLLSLGFWGFASLGALVAWLRWTEGFLHYLKFSAFILFGLTLFGGSTLANRITTVHGDKWGLNMGRYGYEEEYGDGGGLTAIGFTVILVPQIAAIALLIN